MSTDESLALKGDYDGTGTVSDPFSGSLTYGGITEMESPNGKYFLVGTYINYSAMAVSFDSTITDGFGLTANGNSFSGTISKAGVIQFLMDGDVYVEFYAIKETGGTGTIDDPYHGNMMLYGDREEYWVETGTYITVNVGGGYFQVPDGLGLEPDNPDAPGGLYGFVTNPGDYTVNYGLRQNDGTYPYSFTIHVVEASSFSELVFESDPSQGAIEYIST